MLKALFKGLFAADFEAIKTEYNNKINTLQAELENAQQSQESLKQNNESLSLKLEKALKEKEEALKNKQDAENKINEIQNLSNQASKELEPQIKVLTSEKALLEEKLADLQKVSAQNNQTEKALLQESQAEILELKKELTSHQQQNNFFQNQLRQIEAEKNDQIQNLMTKVQELEKKLESIQNSSVKANLPTKPDIPERQQKMVLIVDDALTTRILQKNMLESAGFQVIMGKDGLEGQSLCQENHPDLIITDVEMPKMDGFELTRWLKQSTFREIPVLMVTSHADPEFQQKGREAGADDFIEKTNFNQKTFVEIVNRHL